jgi:hypothetical protein
VCAPYSHLSKHSFSTRSWWCSFPVCVCVCVCVRARELAETEKTTVEGMTAQIRSLSQQLHEKSSTVQTLQGGTKQLATERDAWIQKCERLEHTCEQEKVAFVRKSQSGTSVRLFCLHDRLGSIVIDLSPVGLPRSPLRWIIRSSRLP